MSGFVEAIINRAGLSPILAARRAGAIVQDGEWHRADLLVLGAVADLLRSEENGADVWVHVDAPPGVLFVDGASDLDLLRAVSIERIRCGGRIGVDWGRHGLELAQVALGFGASDLVGPIQRKSGLPILEDESKKVKGEGRVDLASLKRREIALLIQHAGRVAHFTHECAVVERLEHVAQVKGEARV